MVRTRQRARSVLAKKLREHADHLAPVDPDVAAFVLLNAFMRVALMALHDEPGTRAALQRELVRLFSRYLLPEGARVAARASRALARFGAPSNVVAAVAQMKDGDVVFLGQALRPPLEPREAALVIVHPGAEGEVVA